jgi:hypothetical protein
MLVRPDDLVIDWPLGYGHLRGNQAKCQDDDGVDADGDCERTRPYTVNGGRRRLIDRKPV